MNCVDAVKAMIAALESLQLPYMLVGSFSSNFFGLPRSTKDADFVVCLGETPIRVLADSLGSKFRLDPQMSFESVTGTTRYIFHFTEHPFEIEVFLLSDDPHDQERFLRRQKVTTQQGEAFLPTMEDVVITKLRWGRYLGRRKDQDDVRNILSVQAANLDWNYVTRWCQDHGTLDLLEQIRAELPKI